MRRLWALLENKQCITASRCEKQSCRQEQTAVLAHGRRAQSWTLLLCWSVHLLFVVTVVVGWDSTRMRILQHNSCSAAAAACLVSQGLSEHCAGQVGAEAIKCLVVAMHKTDDMLACNYCCGMQAAPVQERARAERRKIPAR